MPSFERALDNWLTRPYREEEQEVEIDWLEEIEKEIEEEWLDE